MAGQAERRHAGGHRQHGARVRGRHLAPRGAGHTARPARGRPWPPGGLRPRACAVPRLPRLPADTPVPGDPNEGRLPAAVRRSGPAFGGALARRGRRRPIGRHPGRRQGGVLEAVHALRGARVPLRADRPQPPGLLTHRAPRGLRRYLRVPGRNAVHGPDLQRAHRRRHGDGPERLARSRTAACGSSACSPS